MKGPPQVIRFTIEAIAESKGYNICEEERNKIEDIIYQKFNQNFELLLSTARDLQRHQQKKKMEVSDVKESFALHRIKPLLGYSSKKAVKYETVGIVNGQRLEIPEDKDIDLASFVTQAPKPYPIENYFSFHWLAAFKGVQPKIEENATELGQEAVGNELLGPPQELKMKDHNVQITSSRNDVYESLYKEYADLMSDFPKESPKERSIKYNKLANDAAIAPLLPFFRNYLSNMTVIDGKPKYIVEKLTQGFLSDKIALARALFKNKSISLNNELTQIICLCLTALINNVQEPLFEYVSLRESAAELLRDIIERFSDTYPDLRKRIVEHLLTIFNEQMRPYPEKLGAAIGLSIIGPELVKHMLIPKIPKCLDSYKKIRDTDQRIQFLKFKSVLMKICGDCFNSDVMEAKEKTGSATLPEDIAKMYNDLVPYFGTDFLLYASRSDN